MIFDQSDRELVVVVSIPDRKPTPVRMAFSIALILEALHAPDDV